MPAPCPNKINTWWLPQSDGYFAQFLSRKDGKHNEFMRDNLLEGLKHVRKRNVAVDVGAHVGFWTFDMAKCFKTVYAFEATQSTYACLLKNVAEFDNVHAYNLAVGDHAGFCKVFGDDKRPGNTGSFYVQEFQQGDVSMIALDDGVGEPLKKLSECDLLKIDVEGFELKVLEGAKGLIKKCRPVIIMECSDRKFIGRYGIPENAAQRWLLKRSYMEVAYKRPDKVFVPG